MARKDDSYPNKLAEDLNRLSKIPVGRVTEIPDNKSFKRTMTLNNRVLKLERDNKMMLALLKSCLILFKAYNVGTLLSPNFEMEHRLESAIKQAEGK